MDSYDVIIVSDAENQLASYIEYLLYEKNSDQAARAVYQDAKDTREELSRIAGSLKLCENKKLRDLGYRKIKFLHHRYVMLYRIVDDNKVYVDAIYHELQDYENTFAEQIENDGVQ